MSFSSGSRESERCRWVRFGGVARLLMNYLLLFMSVVVTSQCLNVVYIVVSNCFLSGSRESECCRWVRFGGVARLLMNYNVFLFMSVVVTSQ